jgi:hypothetical protein
MEPTAETMRDADRNRWMIGGAIAFIAAWWLLKEPAKKVGGYRRRIRRHTR